MRSSFESILANRNGTQAFVPGRDRDIDLEGFRARLEESWRSHEKTAQTIESNNILKFNRQEKPAAENLFAHNPNQPSQYFERSLSPEAQSAEVIIKDLLKNLNQIWNDRLTNEEVKTQKTDALILGLISTLSILSVIPPKYMEEALFAQLPAYIRTQLSNHSDFPKLAKELSYKLQSILSHINRLQPNENQSYFQPA